MKDDRNIGRLLLGYFFRGLLLIVPVAVISVVAFEALRWLETAIRLGNENYRWFESDPNWTDMHEDPRFVELMNRIKSNRGQPGDQSE